MPACLRLSVTAGGLGLEHLEARLLLSNGPVITEFLAVNDSGLQDADLDHSDWIELHNPAASAVDLAGWYLTDDAADLTKWALPAGTSIAPHDYLVAFASSKDRTGAELHTNFKLSGDGEYLALVQADGATVASEFAPTFPPQVSDVSYGLAGDLATAGYFFQPTPGEANAAEIVDNPDRQVLISEIMYHPSSENDLEEYVELYNRGLAAVSLNGWSLSDGVEYTFGDVSIPAGGYLVVAADATAFAAKYPGVANFVAGWTGKLSNRGEAIELIDAGGDQVDRVSYADQGDWAVRELGPLDYGHQGWVWSAEHDGGGKSLELVQVWFPNDYAGNWSASASDQGTPGSANGAAAADIAPIIDDVSHFPVVPSSSDPVTVTATIVDEEIGGVTAAAWYRVDGGGALASVAMTDDGSGADAWAGDGVYSAELPARADGAIVEFYVRAEDAGGLVRTWPAPVQPSGGQEANALYQVDDAFDADAYAPGDQVTYYLIMTEAERATLADIGAGGGDQNSNAQMNATFLAVDGRGATVRYNIGVRNRGHGSRDDPPNNYRLNFVHDRPWEGVVRLNVNSKYTHSQVIGSALFRMAGISAMNATPVQVRVNGQDLASSGGQMYGSYAAIEVRDGDFLSEHFPEDDDGNVYKALRSDTTTEEADLRYEGPNADSYRDTYFKETNEDYDDWSDLIHMLDVLNNAPDATYLQDVSEVIDIDQWLRYLALDTLVLNYETGLDRGIGDDYALYAGTIDTRFKLVPHDQDTMLGQGNATASMDWDVLSYTGLPGLARLLLHPQVLPQYYQALVDMIDDFYNVETLGPLFQHVLGGWVPQATIDEMTQFVADRSAAVLAQIPRGFAIQTSLSTVGGYSRTTNDAVDLSGTADAASTQSVTVNGLAADWDPQTGQWVIGSSAPGETHTLIARGTTWRYLDDGSDQGTTWRAAGFNDSAWSEGAAELGYGDGDETTVTSYGGDSGNKYITTYFRKTFDVADASAYTGLTLRLVRDDGAVVYLNGQEVARSNMPSGAVDYQTHASSAIGGGDEGTYYEFALDAGDLVDGANVVAVELHQANPTSSDTSFNLELEAQLPSGATGAGLTPGINRVAVETYDAPDGTGNVLQSGTIDVWYDTGGTPIVTDSQLAMTVRDSYLPGTGVLVRLDILDGETGLTDRDVWDAIATLATDAPGVTLSTTEVHLYNGRGSALVTVTGSGNFTLTATAGGLADQATLTDLTGAAQTAVSGTLAGTETTWSGVVHVTGDLLVPAGHTLTVEPGTLVLLDGVAGGDTGTDIDVQGTLLSLGTATSPVTFTAYASDQAWGEIHHDGAGDSVYQYTHITRGGHSPAGGHTGTGPVLRPVGSAITFDHVAVTDAEGKIMQASGGSDLTFTDSLLSRAIMGPEIESTSLWFERTWVTEMFGPDDDDGLYVHSQQAGQDVTLRGGVHADGDDDALDTLRATITVEDYILRDFADKGMSVYGGEATLSHVLVVDNAVGVSLKEQGTNVGTVTVDRATVVGNDIAVQVRDKFGEPDVTLAYYITNSILWATDAIQTDYDPADVHISYSDVSELWTGTGNLNDDPQFIDAAGHNYRVPSDSPVVDAGDPAADTDEDGSRADMGFFGGTAAAAGGTIGQDTLLTAADGPYYVTGEVTVADGATLTIEPGVTVFFSSGATLSVRGRLVAEGTADSLIRFTHEPSADGSWGGIQFVDTMADNRLTYAVLEYADTDAGLVGLENSNLTIDSCEFAHAERRRIRSIDSSLIVRNSVFVDHFPGLAAPTTDNRSEHIWGGGIPAGGHWIVEGNTFGVTKGHNDAIDFDAGSRPDPIPQILNNTFLGGGDDALDLEGDAHVEGNVFTHYHKDAYNTDPGESNVISAGSGFHYVVVRNVFYDVDHAVLVKEGSTLEFAHNTVVDSDSGAVYFDVPGQTAGPGAGADVDDSIFADCAQPFDFVGSSPAFTVDNSIVTAAWTGYGAGNLTEDPRLADPAGGDFSLLPGSPALAAAAGGLDMGALVPGGASATGLPAALTASGSATLTVTGAGLTRYKYRLNDGAWSGEAALGDPVVLTGLADGSYTLSLLGRNSAGAWQAEADAWVSPEWTVESSLARVRLSEVLAINEGAVDVDGRLPDLVELRNDGGFEIDLGGLSLTDDPSDPTQFVFPAGTMLGAGEYLTLYADSANGAAGLWLGFGLDGRGEGLYLYDSAAHGGALLDSVEFGLQVADLSIGRVGQAGEWTLATPTFGSANVAQRTGDPARLRISEVLASEQVLFDEDFLELANDDPLPVDLGGLFLTDHPIAQPTLYEVPPLSYVAGGGYAWFQADGKSKSGHVPFGLAWDQEIVALAGTDAAVIDKVLYYPQTTDVSAGPDGQGGLTYYALPTPGLANASATETDAGGMAWDQVWSYEQSDADLGTAWREAAYDDSGWASGAGALGVESAALPEPIRTDLTIGALTYYFRTHFAVDADPATVSLTLTTLLDDGAVFYLNGVEVLRVNMPAGAVTHQTLASTTVSDAAFLGPYDLPAGSLVQGDNVLAVEVHQTNAGSSDVVFAAQVQATSLSYGASIDQALALLDGLRITELMVDPAAGAETEFVELANISDAALDLTGVRLTDGVEFTFPAITLLPGDHVVVVRDLAAFQQQYGPGYNVAGEYSGSLADAGEHLVLQLPAPQTAAALRFEYDPLWVPSSAGLGYAMRASDPLASAAAWDGRAGWQASAAPGGSPAAEDGEAPTVDVIVNEVLTHTDLPQTDSIELHNTSGQAVDVGGWYLSDTSGTFDKFHIPDGTVIAAGEYLVFDEDDFNASLGVDPRDFALDGAHGDDVWLLETDARGRVIRVADTVEFGAVANGESLGRWPNAAGWLTPMSALTLGQANAVPRVGPVVFREIHYNPGVMADAGDLEFIEIHNPQGQAVDLTGWRIRGGVDYDFDAGTVLPADGSIVVLSFHPQDPDNAARLARFVGYYGLASADGLVGGYSGQLGNGGEHLRLERPDEPPLDEPDFTPHLLEDELTYDDAAPWPLQADGLGMSLQRTADDAWGEDPANWTAAVPSPETQAVVNSPPDADAGADVELFDDDLDGQVTVGLDGSGSTDAGGIATYVWREGGQQIATGSAPDVVLAVGEHEIELTVTDLGGLTDTDWVTVTVSPMAMGGPGGRQDVALGQSVNLPWQGGSAQTLVDMWILGPGGWLLAAHDLPGTDGAYSWDTSQATAGWHTATALLRHGANRAVSQCPARMRLAAAPPAPAGQSAALAATAPVAPSVEVHWLSPPGDQSIPVGQPLEIAWELPSGEAAPPSALLVRFDFGGAWESLPAGGGDLAAGRFVWDIPDIAASACQFALAFGEAVQDPMALSAWVTLL